MENNPRAVLLAQTPSHTQIQEIRRRENQQPAIGDAQAEATLARNIEPVGSSKAWWGLTDPADGFYLIMDGRELDPIAYPDLFTVLGTRFNVGAETAGYFRLPNTTGRSIVGAGISPDPLLTTRTVGDKFGVENHVLTTGQLPTHSHTGTAQNAGSHNHGGSTQQDGAHSHTVNAGKRTNTTQTGVGDRLENFDQAGSAGQTVSAPNHNHGIPSESNHSLTLNISDTGGGGSHPNFSPSIAAFEIMRVLP